MDPTLGKPSIRRLTATIVRASRRGLVLNALCAAPAALIWRAPAASIDAINAWLAHNTSIGINLTVQESRSAAWICCALIASILDLILHYRSVHEASTEFSDATRFSRRLATKILGLDTRGADGDKEWAQRTLEGSHIASIGGFLVQFLLGLPLFVVTSLGPWIAFSLFLRLSSWLLASFVLLKLPGIMLAIAQLSTLAIHTWHGRLQGHSAH